MKEVVLVKLGEIALKGLNRRTFEDVLKKNIKKALYGLGYFKLTIAQSTITVTPESKGVDMDKVEDAISRVFGIVSYCRACVCEKDMEDIYAKTPEYLEDILLEAKTFKANPRLGISFQATLWLPTTMVFEHRNRAHHIALSREPKQYGKWWMVAYFSRSDCPDF